MKIERYLEEKKTIKLIDVTYSCNPYSDWGELKRHYHFFHELVIVLKGSVCVEILGKNIRASSGDILFYHEGVPHKEQYAHKNTEIIAFAWEEKIKIRFPVLTHDTSRKICFLAKLAYEREQAGYPYKQLLQENIFKVIIIELMKISESEENHPIIGKVKSFMIDNLSKPLTLENLASCVNMSKYHFLRKYRNITGRTPMEDLRNIRLETAKNILLTTSLPLKAVSSKVGFSNATIFSKLFKKYFRLSPGHFRKNKSWKKNTVFLK
ncbi:MAG: helix-turn-helix domain-containing protein [Elusimicrobia bacterium]|nr:helix-turn-helix domain-containing protein [Elusimicrobiota bacterium]